ncbi:hypothetical protein CLOSTMETH_02833 [[Clostridium] methylpentosum DSM 5476]|uniref:Uncharacterized protein n=1 Tax=[Clostridium] methylpentosum DSM 5476 TaxID=537013 RepID=C0EG41_9FIRM|nr:hypothetical protein CLOSTMETH_02833 [[Clostridium] methylpentosum DSM 5476]
MLPTWCQSASEEQKFWPLPQTVKRCFMVMESTRYAGGRYPVSFRCKCRAVDQPSL